jgi:hypothetical protein
MKEEYKVEDNDCCYKAVFGSDVYKMRRLGRCHYICDYCGRDVSMLRAFYQLSLEETKDYGNTKSTK